MDEFELSAGKFRGQPLPSLNQLIEVGHTYAYARYTNMARFLPVSFIVALMVVCVCGQTFKGETNAMSLFNGNPSGKGDAETRKKWFASRWVVYQRYLFFLRDESDRVRDQASAIAMATAEANVKVGTACVLLDRRIPLAV